MGVRTFETQLFNDSATTQPYHSRVLSILRDAGYVYSDKGAWADGPPGSYVCDVIDVDGRTGTQTYDLRVFEDPARPVIDRIIAVLGD